MQSAGGGAPRPGHADRLPDSLRQLDPAALLMLLLDRDRPEPVRSGAHELALFLTPEPGAEAKEVEETIEGLLLRLEEFCALTDVIRSDTSQILEEDIPLLKAKVTEVRGIYTKVDQLEAFVKMVGHHVSFLEDHVLQAERDYGAFPQALPRWRWLGSRGLPSFRNKLPTPTSRTFELPTLYRTEDYFPADAREAVPLTASCRHHLPRGLEQRWNLRVEAPRCPPAFGGQV
ncbi:breast carcinoma-amplified sequence 4 [Desmodus rotundus]|uniref:breast carcinoma-amplified sequence 4 n=1 Tax=Desmodus rotundus TaxID=9430 RepID=UPI0023815897|nr:breast carcinoma-amplified sequence 4 [Desmodus rotundus]